MSQDRFEAMAREFRTGRSKLTLPALLRRVADEEARECAKVCGAYTALHAQSQAQENAAKTIASMIAERLATRQPPAEAGEET